jgi:hypothetical protein
MMVLLLGDLPVPVNGGEEMDLRARIGIDLGRKLPVEEGAAWAAVNDVR